MDDGEGGLSFDFEGGLDVGPTHPTASNPVIQPAEATTMAGTGAAINSNHLHQGAPPPVAAAVADGGMGANHQRRSFRQTVCRHWLRSLCMKGDACGFLHQYDKSRMPICRFFRQYGECREQDCVYKHTNEDIKECNMYKLGFCPNGPDCRYRHAKLPGPPPPVEEVLRKIQQLTAYSYGNTNRYFQNRNPNFSQQPEKSQVTPGINGFNQAVKPSNGELPTGQQLQSVPSQEHLTQAQLQSMSNGQQNQGIKIATTLPQGTSRYFIVKSCNRENLELSVQQGVWATQRSNEAKLNEAFESVDNVILIFSINRTRHFQGCAKMTSRIGGSVSGGNWKHAHGTGHYGRNFSVKWLKLCELSFHKTRHLRNPYNENLPVKISRDCQEMESSVGEQLASLLYLEPDSELMAVCVAAESKREEERAKGISEIRTEDPDIVPFEDNEEEDEEESEEEEESFGQVYESAGQGRGRGRGMMWPPFMPLARGARPHHGMRGGFPPGLMGGDGYPYSAVGPDGFPLPDPFGMAPRPFGPYGPRFSGDFIGPGMMFPGQPGNFSGGGYGMMMGRNPFMGRPNRPAGMTPLLPPASLQPSQNSNRTRRDQVRGQDMAGSAGPDADTRYQQRGKPQREDGNDDSESEDEAPRRSRHGEGKKKRRSLEGESTSPDVQLP